MSAITDPRVRHLCTRFLEEMYLWNTRVNLTAIPREAAWDKHVEESAGLLHLLPPKCAAAADLGSGAGLPGIPLAIARPEMRMTLIESDTRKAGFLVHVAGLLELRNVDVLAARAEELARDARWREHFDVVVSRAAAPPDHMCELALPLLRCGGELLALTGDAGVRNGTLVTVLGGVLHSDTGGVLRIRKQTPTPDAYPRRSASRRGRPPL